MTSDANDATHANDATFAPEARVKPGANGTPVEINGRTWLLADHVPVLDAVWDALYDQNQLARYYEPDDLRKAGLRLLWANYDLTTEEAVGLIRLADLTVLAQAVESALFGAGDDRRTYSEWVAIALWSNGIDPERLPATFRRAVLESLEASGRTIPASAFISSAQAAAVRKSFAGLMPRPKAVNKPSEEPPGFIRGEESRG